MAVTVCKAEKDPVWQIYKARENVRVLKPVVIHDIVRQVVCRKYSGPSYHWPSSVHSELNHHQVCEFLSEIETENSWLTLPLAHFDKLALVKFHCDLLYPGPRLNFFLNGIAQLLLPNNEWLGELASAADFDLKLYGKTVPGWETCTAAQSFQQSLMLESQRQAPLCTSHPTEKRGPRRHPDL